MSGPQLSKPITRSTKYLLNNGQQIPVAGFGTYLLPVQETSALVYEALLQGYRHIDGATAYNNQKEAAQGIYQFLQDNVNTVSREDIWFTTKICNEAQGYEATKQAVAEISEEIKQYIDYIDLVLVHSPTTSSEKRIGTWRALSEIYRNPVQNAIKVRTIGVSNYGVHHIEEIMKMGEQVVVPAINQLELHPWLPRVKLREYLMKEGIAIEAYSPLVRGRNDQDLQLDRWAEKLKILPVEILLKWSYLQGFIVLTKSANKARIIQNIGILPVNSSKGEASLSHFELPQALLDVLNKPSSHKVFTWGGVDPTEFQD